MIRFRFYAIAGIFLLFTGNLFAQAPQKLKIDEATVFLSGAELVSNADISLVKGENEILFTNVAGDVNDKSLTVGASNGVVVEAVTFRNDYLAAETFSSQVKEIEDSIEIVTERNEEIKNKITVMSREVSLLWKADTNLSAPGLAKMLDLVSERMEGYLNQKTRLQVVLEKTDEQLTKLNSQLDELQKKAQPQGALRVKFYATEATNASVTVTYIITHAGWSPTYDIYADDIHSPVKLFYKANIEQNSGINWNNVHLSLSTGNPNEGIRAPVLNPWYLAFYVPPPARTAYNNRSNGDGLSAAPEIHAYKKPLIDQDKTSTILTSSVNDYVAVDNAGVNTTFDIDLPYTIPSDGQQHLVSMKHFELPATYRYFAIPKSDKDAFLQAQITNWQDLNLLPGQSNIFYEGTYVGQGPIDVRNLTDTLYLSLGRDKKILIKRDRDTKLRSVKTIGSNVRETFAYTITVRNTRKENINLTVQDQLPVSNDKDIVLEDTDTGGSEYNETTGMMKWALDIAPNETKKLSFGYTVKYPRGKTVTGLR